MKRLLLILALATPAFVQADAKRDWAKSFEKRPAILKIDLPTLDPDQVGLLVLSSVRGTYYAYQRLFDRTPEQLMTKILSDRQMGNSLTAPGIAHLTVLKAGSKVTLKKIDLNDRMAVVWLWDEFARQETTHGLFTGQLAQQPSTSFGIEWPTRWSKSFEEAPAIEKLMSMAIDFTTTPR